jgi:signal transduction histidine kinase
LARLLQVLREAQLQLVGAARRAAAASLARGLAHEINNALTPILGHAQLLALRHAGEPDTAARANEIAQLTRRITIWTASLGRMAADGSGGRMGFSFNALLREVLDLYGERFHRLGIEATLDLEESVPAVVGSVDQVREMWMNLVQRAVEGMPGGGQLRVTTRFLPDEAAVLTELSDTGTGIPVNSLDALFKPGAASDPGHGTNGTDWGLFTVRHIVQAHRGRLQVTRSATGTAPGTTVRVTLPLDADLGS